MAVSLLVVGQWWCWCLSVRGFKTLVRGSCSGAPTSPVSCLDRLFVSAQIAAGSVTESWPPPLTDRVNVFVHQ